MRPYLLLILVAAFGPPSLEAQGPDTFPLSVGGHLLFAGPVGEFDENVDFGFGLGGHGRLEVPPVAVPLPMLDPEPSVVPGVGAS